MKKKLTIKVLLLLVLSSTLLLLVPVSFASPPPDNVGFARFVSYASSFSETSNQIVQINFDVQLDYLDTSWVVTELPYFVSPSDIYHIGLVIPLFPWRFYTYNSDVITYFKFVRFRIEVVSAGSSSENVLVVEFFRPDDSYSVPYLRVSAGSYDPYFHYSGIFSFQYRQLDFIGYSLDDYSSVRYDTGFSNGYADGYFYGNADGYDFGRVVGYDEGFDAGRVVGYDEGFDAVVTNANKGIMPILTSTFQGLNEFLNIKILNNITFGMIVAIPLIFGVIAFILGGVRKKDD